MDEGILNVMELFAGGGGGIYGGLLLGHTPVCAVEIVAKNRELLLQRQRDGIMPKFPVWDDVRTFDGLPWRGVVDVVSGGFPCTDISVAGKGAGIEGEQSGLWREMARIIGDVRPRYAFVENSPALVTRGLGRVLGDLAALGYDCRWTVLSAADCGAPHRRERIWIMGRDANGNNVNKEREILARENSDASRACEIPHTEGERRKKRCSFRRNEPEERASSACEDVADSECVRWREPPGNLDETQGPLHQTKRKESTVWAGSSGADGRTETWPAEPGVCRVVDGVADWKHRIFALGNGQVPRVHAAAWRMLNSAL